MVGSGERGATGGLLEVRLLGSVEFRFDGRRLDVARGRLAALLTYLILHGSDRQPRSRLAYQFWPDSTDVQARTNLRQLLHQLRRSLPQASSFVGIGDDVVWWLDTAPARVDVVDFSDAAAAAERQPSPATLAAAVDAYGGDLLPGSWDEWVIAARNGLRSQWLALLGQLADELAGAGHHRAAIRAVHRQLEADPLDERAYQRLMRLHAACGERARALQAFHRCERALRRELDVDVSAQTRQLHAELVRAPGPTTLDPDPPGLLGRADEVAQLHRAWVRAGAAERPLLALVTGEPGIGKTALVEAVADGCRRRGASVARARCYEAVGALPYAPIAGWLREGALTQAVLRLDEPWRREVTRLLPELETGTGTDVVGDRRRLFEALAAALRPAEVPLMLVLDDAQWCDDDTLEFLGYLFGQPAGRGVLVVATARDGALDLRRPLGLLATGAGSRDQLVRLPLGPLHPDACAELARSAASGPMPPEVVDSAVKESEGNPLFCVEMVRAWHAGGNRPTDGVPPRVHALIESRLATLDRPATDVVNLAAVIGRSFDADLVSAATDLPEADLVAGFDELWRRRIVSDSGPMSYDFTHDKLREVAYQRLPPALRWHLHGAVANAMVRRPGTPAAELARHLECAGRQSEAIDALRRAADEALTLFAHEDVVGLAERALTLLSAQDPGPPRDRTEVDVRQLLGTALVARRGYAHDDVLVCYERARELAATLEPPARGPLLRGLAICRLSRCELDAAVELGDELRAIAARHDDPMLAVEAAYVQGVTAHWQGDFERAVELLEQALARYQPRHLTEHLRCYAQDPSVICRSRLAYALAQRGQRDRARTLVAEAVSGAVELGHPPSLAYAHNYASWVAVEDGADGAERFARHVAALLAVTARHQVGFFAPTADILAGWLAATRGEGHAGRDRIQAGIRTMTETGQVLHRSFGLWLLARAHLVEGDVPGARAALADARAHGERTGQRYLDGHLDRLHGRIESG